jgi:hypothetical protein
MWRYKSHENDRTWTVWNVFDKGCQPLLSTLPGRHRLILSPLFGKDVGLVVDRIAHPVFFQNSSCRYTYAGHFTHYRDPEPLAEWDESKFLTDNIK